MRQIQYLANTFNHLDVQLRKVFPMVCVYLPENINIIIEVRLGFGICKLTIRREAALVVHLLE